MENEKYLIRQNGTYEAVSLVELMERFNDAFVTETKHHIDDLHFRTVELIGSSGDLMEVEI